MDGRRKETTERDGTGSCDPRLGESKQRALDWAGWVDGRSVAGAGKRWVALVGQTRQAEALRSHGPHPPPPRSRPALAPFSPAHVPPPPAEPPPQLSLPRARSGQKGCDLPRKAPRAQSSNSRPAAEVCATRGLRASCHRAHGSTRRGPRRRPAQHKVAIPANSKASQAAWTMSLPCERWAAPPGRLPVHAHGLALHLLLSLYYLGLQLPRAPHSFGVWPGTDGALQYAPDAST